MDNIVYTSDITARIDDLRQVLDTVWADQDTDLPFEDAVKDASRFPEYGLEADDYNRLMGIMGELLNYNGDYEWGGNWYPDILIRDSHFTQHIREYVEDRGYTPDDLPNWLSIDWQKTADNLRHDYVTVDIDNDTYYYRAH